jgi:tetratricopeptide (TPR) repeat protein
MPPKQRQIQMQQRGGLAAIQQLESRSDEELERETRHKAAAQAILGARAAERYDAKKARAHFQSALAAARPQERMQLKRMADASLALAERRAGDLKEAVQKLGQEAPSNRQLLALRFMGLVAPPQSAGVLARVRGIVMAVALVVALMAVGLGVVELIALPLGGVGLGPGLFYGALLVVLVLGVLALVGRRRQRKARERAAA